MATTTPLGQFDVISNEIRKSAAAIMRVEPPCADDARRLRYLLEKAIAIAREAYQSGALPWIQALENGGGR